MLWIVIAVAFSLRLAVVAGNARVTPDGLDYSQAAQNILHGNGFSLSAHAPFIPCTIRDPLYSVLVAAVYGVLGVHALPVYLLQICCSLVAVVVVYCMALHYFGLLAARVTAALGAFHIGSIVWVADLVTETLYITLLLAGCWLFVGPAGRWPTGRRCAGVVLLAAATLTRSEAALFCAGLILICTLAGSWRWPALKRAFLFLLLWLVPISPWLVRNFAHSHRVFLRDPNVMIAAVSVSLSNDFSDPSYAAVFQHPGGMSGEEAASHWKRIRERLRSEWSDGRADFVCQRLVRLTDAWISPPGRMKVFGGTFFDTFTVIGPLLANGRYGEAIGRAALYLLFGVIPLLTCCAAAAWLWRSAPDTRWLLWYPAYISAISLVVYADRRYSLAGQYFLMPFLGWALSVPWRSHGVGASAAVGKPSQPNTEGMDGVPAV
ncbi:MAG: glycosyltransferase family 39 protein [Bryobacteraceae bacterium]